MYCIRPENTITNKNSLKEILNIYIYIEFKRYLNYIIHK